MTGRFDRVGYPLVPRGAIGKGDTLFHRRARFWREAVNAVEAYEANNGGGVFELETEDVASCLWDVAKRAIEKFEAHCDAMDAFYRVLCDATSEAKEAVEKAGLAADSNEGCLFYEEVEQNYRREHPVIFPE